MIDRILPRHPRIGLTEGILAYQLRLSEVNGYESPLQLRNFAGIHPAESIASANALAKLAAVTRQPAELVGNGDGNSLLIRCPLELEFLRVAEKYMQTQVCPDCIRDRGFIEAHWTIPQMYACPIHRRTALRSCSSCGTALSWYRLGLLRCACGAELVAAGETINEGEAVLLDVIRRKTLALPQSTTPIGGMPIADLNRMDLMVLLRLIDTLARLQGGNQRQANQQTLRLAMCVLEMWPRGLVRLLDPADPGGRQQEQYQRRVNNTYRLLCGGTDQRRTQSRFIGAVIVEYAFTRWGYRHTTFDDYQSSLPTGLLDTTIKCQVAAIGRRGKRGQSSSVIRTATSLSLAQSDAVNSEWASHRLSIPKDVLDVLSRSGTLRSHRAGLAEEQFLRDDLDAFRERLIDSANVSPSSAMDDGVSLGSILHWEGVSARTRAALLEAILADELTVERGSAVRANELLLHRRDYLDFAARHARPARTATPREAARLIGCPEATIPGLVRMGLLQAAVAGSTWEIDRDSVESFDREYLFLRVLARQEHASREWLRRACRIHRIPTLWPITAIGSGKQPFIRRKYLVVLKSRLEWKSAVRRGTGSK
jgi:hypothetical protein